MTIELISKEDFEFIKDVYKEHPVLTLQNKGYEYIKAELTEDEKKARLKVSEVLSKHIKGYSSFTNFKLSNKEKKLQIRFQYNYGADHDNGHPFIGVGYILLDELFYGFN